MQFFPTLFHVSYGCVFAIMKVSHVWSYLMINQFLYNFLESSYCYFLENNTYICIFIKGPLSYSTSRPYISWH